MPSVPEFSAFAHPLPEPTLLLSGEGRVLAANPAFHALALDAQSCDDRPLADLTLDPPEKIARYLKRCAGTRSFVLGALVFRGRDGSQVPCRTEGCLLRAADEAAAVQLLLRLTPKASANALRESEARFRQLADVMPQVVWTADASGQVDYFNRRWTELTGLPQTLGNPGWTRVMHPEDAPEARRLWAASFSKGHSFEMPIRLLDGSTGTYRWHLMRTVGVTNDQGQVTRWFGTATDIDEQKRAEASARYLAAASAALASVADYRSTLQEVANLAVPEFADWSAVDVLIDGRLDRLAVAHRDPDRVALVRQIAEEYPADPEAPKGIVAVLRTGVPELVREIPDESFERVARDARHLDLIRSLGLKSFIAVPLTRPSGDTFGVLTFATAESGRLYDDGDLRLAMDLAHRASIAVENTRLYQALRESDTRKDEFLAILAHELRNPLAPLSNALQMLTMPDVAPDIVARAHEMMVRQVAHLTRLIDDLMDVSRVMQGKIELRRATVDLSRLVARAVDAMQPLIDAQGHQLNVLLADAVPVKGDAIRLTQVVSNLLANAIKFTPPAGDILVTVERDESAAIVRVRDNGVGVAPEVRHRIFDMFVQGTRSGTSVQGGLGIGLTLVRNLVELHEGTVEVHSEGPGHGAEFVVRLPLSTDAVVAEVLPPKASPAATDESGYRVLVVDDNQDAADSLALLLRLQGHDVRVAHGGEAALVEAEACEPDVVFLDLGMPDPDGYEVARRLKSRPGSRDVVLAALTGWGQLADRQRTIDAGFDHHIVKPPEAGALDRVFDELRRRTTASGADGRVGWVDTLPE